MQWQDISSNHTHTPYATINELTCVSRFLLIEITTTMTKYICLLTNSFQ